MEFKEIFKTLFIDIRAILCSSKEGLSESELKTDYRVLTGHQLPYRIIGFRSLYEFMRIVPGVEIRKHPSGDIWIYHAVHDDLTKNLGDLVEGQKDNYHMTRELNRCKEINFVKSMRSRSAMNSHIMIQPTASAVTTTNLHHHVRSHTRSPSPKSKPIGIGQNKCFPSEVPSLIKKQIELILLDSNRNNSQTLKDFTQSYIKKFGFLFSPRAFGYDTLLDFLRNQDFIDVVENENEICVRLKNEPNNNLDNFTLNLNILKSSPNSILPNRKMFDDDRGAADAEITQISCIRTKLVRVSELDNGTFVEYNLNLISIDNQIFVYWTQVAALFGLKEVAFKSFIGNVSNGFYDNQIKKNFVRKFKMSENNKVLFDLIERKLNIKETFELVLIFYDRLFSCCEFVFTEENCKRVKDLILKFYEK